MNMHPDLKRGLITGAAVIGLGAAFLLGGGTGYGTAYFTAPDPEPCLTALDRADDAFTLIDERNATIADGMTAYEALDVAGIDQATEDIGTIDDQIEALRYPDARDECREVFDR